MSDDSNIKTELKGFYRQEAIDHNSDQWIECGEGRVLESKAAHYFIDPKINQALPLA